MDPFSTSTTRGKRSLAQGVAEDMQRRIQQDHLKPGDKLPPESAIMAQFGVSRTVVREAISQLQAGGLVQTRHGIGTFVLEPPVAAIGISANSIVTVRDVLAILELRISLETEAAWLAASRRSEEHLGQMEQALSDMRAALQAERSTVDADRRFHRVIALATANPYFVDVLGHLGSALIPRTRLDTPSLDSESPADYLERMNREHEVIYKAIARRDPEAARAAMRMHLSNSRERLREAQQRLEAPPG